MEENRKKFIEKFNYHKYGFYDRNLYINVDLGFSIKKKYKKNKNISLISFYVPNEDFNNTELDKKPIIASASYGKMTEFGLEIKDRPKLDFKNPLDINSLDEYFYNVKTEKFYRKNKEITADKLMNDFYNGHIKITKPIRGLRLRIKLILWKFIIKKFVELIPTMFSGLLFLISGNKYKYKYIHKTHIINDEEIESREFKPEDLKKILEERPRKTFLGYEVSEWAVFTYALIHLVLYTLFYFEKNIFELSESVINFVVAIFNNNFLVLIYVVVTITIYDSYLPKLLFNIIPKIYKKTFLYSHKSIKV